MWLHPACACAVRSDLAGAVSVCRLEVLWDSTGLICPLKQNKTKKTQPQQVDALSRWGEGCRTGASISITPNGCCTAAAEPGPWQRRPQQGSGRPQCCDLKGFDAWRPAACIATMHPCSRRDFTRSFLFVHGLQDALCLLGCEHLLSRGDERHYRSGRSEIGGRRVPVLAAQLLLWLNHVYYASYRFFWGKIVRRKEQVETRMELKLSGPPVVFPGREERAGTFCMCLQSR